jgi:hypothetical protein
VGFDSSTGVISGTLTTAGDYSFTISATDSASLAGSQHYHVIVSETSAGGSSPSSSAGSSSAPDTSVSLCGASGPAFIRADIPADSASLGGVHASVYCRELTDPAQHGVTDRPVIHAVEIFALTDGQPSRSVTTFNHPITVCLQGQGQMLFRDANGQSRTLVGLPSFEQDGYTCVSIGSAGTLILDDAPGNLPAEPPAHPAAATLDTCQVTTLYRLNLRASADVHSPVLALVPYQTTLRATARQGDFVQVVFGDQQGWLSLNYLTSTGACG